MSVEEAILELLKVHNRVIVPGFGAFLVAKDDVDSKPYVLFNGFLSFNDGLLVDYLAEKNGIDTIVSSDNIAEYVYTLKHGLQEEKIYKFNLLGTFDFEESGSMRFRYNPNVGRTPQKPSAHAKPVAKKDDAKKEEKIVEKEEAKVSKAKTEVKSESATPNVEPVLKTTLLELDKNNVAPDIIIEPEVSSSKSERETLTKSSFELDEVSARGNSSKFIESHKSPLDVDIEVRNKQKRKVVFVLLILIPILLIAGYIFLSYLPAKRAEEARKVAMEVEAKKQSALRLQADSIDLIKVRELALADSLRIADESRAKLGNSGYHIIVGAFAEEANADKMVAKLKQASFTSTQKLNYKNRFLVSVDASQDKEDAIKRMQKFSASNELDCWLHLVK